MKKSLVLIALVLTIATSVLAGTLAVYNVTLDNITNSSNQVVAKNFVFTGAGVDNFNSAVKIAPTETVTKKFTIANFDATGTTETDMTVTGTLTLAGGIEGLVVTLKNGTNTVGTATVTGGTASISINDTFTKDVAETHTYTVEVKWPSGSNDIDYINEANTLTLTLTGTQA